jgi:transcriptional regulator with XRE-family HTH domain
MSLVKKERAYPETVRDAARLLGALVREGRIDRRWTVSELADRGGISKNTVTKVEHGDPSVALGTAFDLAVLVGVSLFYEDRSRLRGESRAARERVALIGQRVRSAREVPDYDF